MKTLRHLQLRQGQELSQSELQHIVGGERFFCQFRVGQCTCVNVGNTHGETLYGYTLSNDYLGMLAGGATAIGGAIYSFSTGGVGSFIGGGAAIIGGAAQFYSSINQRKSAIRHAIMTLVNCNPKTHTESIL